MKKFRFILPMLLMTAVIVLSACVPSTPAASTPTSAGPAAGITPVVTMPVGTETPVFIPTSTLQATLPPAVTVTVPSVTTATPVGGALACEPNVDSQELVNTGEGIYNQQCASCHGAQGEGVGSFPALAGNPAINADDTSTLISGFLQVQAHPQLDNQQLAAVLSYARGSFGNTKSFVCPSQVDAVRPPQ